MNKLAVTTRIVRNVTVDPNGCWLWGQVGQYGYGLVCEKSATMQAHRWVWKQLVGPVDDDLHIDHLCRVRACVNPDHLEPVTPAENTRRMHEARGSYFCQEHQAPKVVRSGAHVCLACRSDQARKRRASLTPESAPHGTMNGYINYKCRCDECRNAASEWRRARRASRVA